ncbi:ribonuclease P/MRP protein subunit POP5-like [Saccoglossus kowalevskii]|uniref:Ribonuclease P/MRP protein subunit POP5 n=1 Tax=Saccoglossus kowalevskii TaxID=10224 RepID=A0ABM0GP21_SACKO|nr:PREDICTED: ribonuclease P/MRP protein subunit POP5-like [Saccoglossus kowalevskii]
MVRFKNRYILCELVFEDDFLVHPTEERNLYYKIKEAIAKAHGDYGVGVLQGGLSVKYLNVYTNIVFIRARRAYHKLVLSALPFIRSIAKYSCFLNTLHVGGSIRSCQKFLQKYGRQQLAILLRKCKTQEEKQEVQKSILNCSLIEKDQVTVEDDIGD